uniref:Uncharacterized protein n=1 Tax=Aegilops tauschii subsp. strangulata TaxID=200361 RepID=A0A453J2D4_AEGTS
AAADTAATVAAVVGLSGTAALPLDGRVAIVTGASRGIGRAIAAHLSSLGASVVLGYASSAAEADALAVELPRAVAVRADVSDEASVRSLFDAAESAFRCAAPHILVANAGVIDDKYPSLADTTTADFDHAFAVNTRGAFLYLPRGRQPHAPRRPDRGSDDVRGWVAPDGVLCLHGVQGGRGGHGADDGQGAQGHADHGQLRGAGANGHGHVLRREERRDREGDRGDQPDGAARGGRRHRAGGRVPLHRRR